MNINSKWVRRPRRLLSALVLLIPACVVLPAASGCSSNQYNVRIICDPVINNYKDQSKKGRLLDVALICLSNADLKKLSETEGFGGGVDWRDKTPDQWITAEAYFSKGLDAKIARVIQSPGAVWSMPVAGGSDNVAKLTHPGASGDRAGILALADFEGLTPDNRHLFETSAWMRTSWRNRATSLRVGQTTIRWAEGK